MKRSPIARRTPLARSTTPLARTPLRRRSAKMEAAYAGKDGRRAFVAKYLAEHPVCEVQTIACVGRSVDCHEPLQRSAQGSITDPENTLAVCRPCHGYIHEHPKESGEKRWLINKHTP